MRIADSHRETNTRGLPEPTALRCRCLSQAPCQVMIKGRSCRVVKPRPGCPDLVVVQLAGKKPLQAGPVSTL